MTINPLASTISIEDAAIVAAQLSGYVTAEELYSSNPEKVLQRRDLLDAGLLPNLEKCAQVLEALRLELFRKLDSYSPSERSRLLQSPNTPSNYIGPLEVTYWGEEEQYLEGDGTPEYPTGILQTPTPISATVTRESLSAWFRRMGDEKSASMFDLGHMLPLSEDLSPEVFTTEERKNLLSELVKKEEKIQRLETKVEELSQLDDGRIDIYAPGFPEDLALAVRAYQDCYQALPDGMAPPTDDQVAEYIRTRLDDTVQKNLSEMITRVARPRKYGKGGPRQTHSHALAWKPRQDR